MPKGSESEPLHIETINGVKFNVAEIDGLATGNLIRGYVYRSFHKGKCYELDIRIASSNLTGGNRMTFVRRSLPFVPMFLATPKELSHAWRIPLAVSRKAPTFKLPLFP